MFIDFKVTFSCILVAIIKVTMTQIPTNYSAPLLNLTSKFNFDSSLASLVTPTNTTYTKMKATDFYVSRLTSSGQLEIYDLISKTLKYYIFGSTSKVSSLGAISYDLPQYENDSLVVVLNSNEAKGFNLTSNGSFPVFYATSSSNLTTDCQIVAQQALSIRFNLSSSITQVMQQNLLYIFRKETSMNFKMYNLKTCQVDKNDPTFRLALWKGNCFVKTYNCTADKGCQQYVFIDDNIDCSSTELESQIRDTTQLDWSKDCTKIMYESKTNGIKVVDLNTSLTIATFNISYPSDSWIGFWFLDDYGINAGVLWANGKFDIYNISSGAQKIDSKIVESGSAGTFDKNGKTLYISSGLHLYAYKLGCLDYRYDLQTTGICLPNMTYFTPPVVTNTTNSSATNTTNNTNTSTNSSNTTSNTTVNNTANNTVINSTTSNPSNTSKTPNNSLTKKPEPVYPESQMISGIQNNFQAAGPALQVSFSMINALPIGFIFIKFVNFWSICTMYLLLDIPFPTYIRDILTSIYEYMNMSLFQAIGLAPNFPTNLSEKIQGDDLQIFGFSSDFLNQNFQNFAFLLLAFVLLIFIYFVGRLFPQTSPLKNVFLHINYLLIGFGQYISMMSTFFLDLPVISEKSYQQNFSQKINMVLHNFFFIFSAVLSVSIVIFMKKIKNQKVQFEGRPMRNNWLYDAQCNALFPLIAILRNVPFFLVFNLLFFCVPIYTAIKQSKYRANFIIKSLYLQFFNLGAIILCISDQYDSLETKRYVGLSMLCIIFVGAIHQIFELMIGWIYNVYIFFFTRKDKVVSFSPSTSETKNSQGNLLTIEETKVVQKIVRKTVNPVKHMVRISRNFNSFEIMEHFRKDQDSLKQTDIFSDNGSIKIKSELQIQKTIKTSHRLKRKFQQIHANSSTQVSCNSIGSSVRKRPLKLKKRKNPEGEKGMKSSTTSIKISKTLKEFPLKEDAILQMQQTEGSEISVIGSQN